MITRRMTKRAALAAMNDFYIKMLEDELPLDSSFRKAVCFNSDGFVLTIERREDIISIDSTFNDDELPF